MSRLLKIGIFVLITGVGTVFYMMRTAERIDARETYTVEVFMDDASGLFVDSNVRFAGVNVGKIREIKLEKGKAKLTLELSKEVQLYEDARIVKSLESMLGISAVSVFPGENVNAPLRAGGMIQNAVSSNVMDQTFLGASALTEEATLMIKELRAFLSDDGGYSTLKEILTAAKDTTEMSKQLIERNLVLMASALEDIGAITRQLRMNSGADVARLSAILKSTADITERIDKILASNEDNIDMTLVSVRESIDKLRSTLDQVNNVAVKINSGEGNLGKLVNDDKLYDKIVNITGQVEGYVNSTIGLDLQVAFQSDYLVNQADTRNQFGIRLTPQDKNKYYSLSFVDSPRLNETKTETLTVQSGTITENYTTWETEKTRKLLINAQIARRFGLFTLRGGVIESTGGVGVDFQPLSRVALSTEVFDFGQENAPYLRVYGTIYPFFNPALSNPLNWIYMNGGVDNVLVSDRDYFLGLGLRFSDSDLKGLVGYIPTN